MPKLSAFLSCGEASSNIKELAEINYPAAELRGNLFEVYYHLSLSVKGSAFVLYYYIAALAT